MSGVAWSSRWACALLLLGLPAGSAAAQSWVRYETAGRAPAWAEVPAGGLFAAAGGDSLEALLTYDPDAEVDLLVQFVSPPLARIEDGPSKSSAVAGALSAMDGERARFLSEASLSPTRDYRRAFNGVALTAKQRDVYRYQALPYVARVYVDQPVHALGTASGRAPRPARPARDGGAGVVIAVLDTGIDYTHPGLGGGFGPAFKVRGGFDFIGGDPDPMDENGHGTHVAGIAAAAGAEPGVAPAATLMAVRVLDAGGVGASSVVLAGLEYALDPDGDPLTDDAVDVINLSLGFRGSPFHPLAQAVDNAVAAGVVCVVASGNQGYYRQVHVPGTAPGAITVGASDEEDEVAGFSARGPTPLTFANKPDLVAPGVAIRAPAPGGGYATFSGTSMAAPHVSGSAALLLEQHPDWTPARIKAALVQSADDLGDDVWTQGGGRLDPEAALERPLLITPTTLGLGLLDLTRPNAAYSETLTIHNPTAQTRTVALTVETGTLTDPARPTVTPESVVLAPGASAPVTVSAAFALNDVPYRRIEPPSFVGFVVATSGETAVRIPVTFLKAHHLAFDFDGVSPMLVLVHDGDRVAASFSQSALIGTDVAPLPLPEGTYDIAALFRVPNRENDVLALDVHEGITHANTTPVRMTWKRASNTIAHTLAAADGTAIHPDYTFVRLIYDGGALDLDLGLPHHIDDLRIASLSERYRLDVLYQSLSHPSGADYTLAFSHGPGLTDDLRFTADPADYRRHDTHHRPGEATTLLGMLPTIYTRLPDRRVRRVTFLDEALLPHLLIHPPFVRSVYYNAPPAAGTSYRFQSTFLYDATHAGRPVPIGEGSNQIGESVIVEPGAQALRTVRSVTSGVAVDHAAGTVLETTSGLAPPFFTARFDNRTNRIETIDDDFAPFFANPGGDLRLLDVAFEAFADGERFLHGTRSNTLPVLVLRRPPEARRHEVVFSAEGYAVRGVPGRVTARAGMTLAEDGDRNPPYLAMLRLHSGGQPTDAFVPGADNRITARAFDVAGDEALGPVASARFFYRRWGGAEWTPLPTTQQNEHAEARWPGGLAPGFYDLRLRLEDAAGNALDMSAEPALRFGTAEGNTPPAPFALRTPEDGATLDPGTSTAFAWDAAVDPDGDPLTYRLRLSGPGLDTTYAAGTSTLHTVNLAGRVEAGQSYAWHVDASDGFSVTPSAQAFTVQIPISTRDEEAAVLPDAPVLESAYPTPTAGRTTIAFVLPTPERVRLEVFDVLGRRRAVLAEGHFAAGRHTATWDPGTSPAGLYFYRLTAGAAVRTRSLLRVR